MERFKNVFMMVLFTLAMVCVLGCGNSLQVEAGGETLENNIIAEVQTEPKETIEEEIHGNHIQWWPGEWKTEYITNSVGKEMELHYLESIIWPETEEETLAKFLISEGGTYEEKTRIAQLLCWRKGNSDYPDTIQEILKFNDYFVINPEFWNTYAEPTDEDYEIARSALESTERPEYIHYFFREFYEEEFEKNEPNVETYKTENYVFYN